MSPSLPLGGKAAGNDVAASAPAAEAPIKRKLIPYKWELIILLWDAFFLNQGDRQVFNSVIPLIRESLGLSDCQLGLVGTVFTIFYGVLVPVAGFAGEVIQKRWIVFLSLFTFSLGTLATGFAGGLALLGLFRCKKWLA